MSEITQAELRHLLDYDPETGIFIWKNPSKYNDVQPGDIAGCHGNCGYWRIGIKRRRYQAHLLAWLYMYGQFPEKEIDHINHVRDDNRIANLREVESAGNKRNLSLAKNNKSGVTGVSWSNRYQAWVVQIQVHGQNIYRGRYKDKAEAIAVRKAAEREFEFHENHGMKVA